MFLLQYQHPRDIKQDTYGVTQAYKNEYSY